MRESRHKPNVQFSYSSTTSSFTPTFVLSASQPNLFLNLNATHDTTTLKGDDRDFRTNAPTQDAS